MATLKEAAQNYSSTQILNIADLEIVSVDVEFKEETDCEFPYSYIEVDGNKYRVPKSVLQDLKAMLEDNPELQKFRVKKTGEGMSTSYTVIPLI
jgi:hypothetical protein